MTSAVAALPYHSKVVRPVAVGRSNGADVQAYPVGNLVGESPCWHTGQGMLYWIDVRGQQLLRLQPERDLVERWELPDVVGTLALSQTGEVWLALRHGLQAFDPVTRKLRLIAHVEAGRPDNRLNDGKVSPSGRWFVFGSMDDRPSKEATGALYCASATGEVKKLWAGLVVANGIAFSADGRTLHFSDSARGLVFKADWYDTLGKMGEPVSWCALGEAQGRPDGAAIDTAGRYWSAGVSAGCLNVLDAAGAVCDKVRLPCQAPTMPAFGGTDAKTLFVTSLVRPQWSTVGVADGALLMIPSPVTGIPGALLQTP
jgi:sugar lactone lactonase YvrE